MIHIAVYAAVFVTVVILVVASQFDLFAGRRPDPEEMFAGRRPDPEETSEEDEVTSTKKDIVIDQKRAFCQTVRFAMRLKRKMRRFKHRKQTTNTKKTD